MVGVRIDSGILVAEILRNIAQQHLLREVHAHKGE